MTNAELCKKYGRTDEERLLLARLFELQQRALERGTVEFSDFLTPAECALALAVPELSRGPAELRFHGGWDEAERALVSFRERDLPYDVEPPIKALAVVPSAGTLGNRDILGAVMALGIRRDKLGDILDRADPPLLLCDADIARYLIDNLERAGRVRVSVRETTVGVIPPPQFRRVTATVSSLRLDSVTAEGFGISRARAAEAIRQGHVSLNWVECTNVSREVAAGDRISLRGEGKVRLTEVGGVSRKGRTFLAIDRYV